VPANQRYWDWWPPGRCNRGIGDELFLTERGVEKHVRNIYSKLELPLAGADHRRVLAALTYISGAERQSRERPPSARARQRKASV
jgi:hypothetical protein